MTFPIYSTDTLLDAHDLWQNSFFSLEKDWYGQTTGEKIEFAVAIDPLSLHFLFKTTARSNCSASNKMGDFVEGLWKEDVAELFISSKNEERYLELNLSPSGAWWAALFTEYRKRDESYTGRKAKTFARSGMDGWRACLSIKLSELPFDFSQANLLRVNMACVLGKTTRRYYTWSSINVTAPDFHKIRDFSPVKIIKLPSPNKSRN